LSVGVAVGIVVVGCDGIGGICVGGVVAVGGVNDVGDGVVIICVVVVYGIVGGDIGDIIVIHGIGVVGVDGVGRNAVSNRDDGVMHVFGVCES